MKKWLAVSAVLAINTISSLSYAHSEHDKARFVSEHGSDVGRCDNVIRPCKSIAYAAKQANKGDKVLVASGTYNIDNEDDLFNFKSGLVPIKGGYNRFDHFQSQSPQSNKVTLLGVPSNMRSEIEAMGFSVAVDGKHSLASEKLKTKLASFNEMSKSHAAEQCINNIARSFDCQNIDLLSHMSLQDFSSSPGSGNDIWGHVDLNTGDEYAIIGLQNGVAVVNVTDPENPVEVGTITGQLSSWRDIKVYQYFDHTLNLWRAYAYATVDRSNNYVTVIDLNHLPESISLAENNFSVGNAHNVYISNVDHTLNIALPNMTPSLQLMGTNKVGGAFHNYSLANPNTITLTSSNSGGSGYTHDGTSLIIKDNRKITDCGLSDGPCTVFIDFQGRVYSDEVDMIKLWNITDNKNAKLLSNYTYKDIPFSDQYIHSGWATEDNNYFFAHDEFDESYAGNNTTIRIFSIEDLKNPRRIGTWTGPSQAVDHNGYVRGNRYYMSNYMKGLTVLDITDPANPTDIGNFDTFPTSNRASYDGAWGVYPFLPSGNILISDISGGLFVLKDNTLMSTQGSISFNQKEISTPQGNALRVDVFRNSPVDNASTVSVSYEILPGSAKQNEDYTPVTGTLTWQDNSEGVQSFTIPITEQSNEMEFQESFFVRLFDPRNGATLTSPSYLKVSIAGETDNGKVGFTAAKITVPENQPTLTIEVARDGSVEGEVSVNYTLRPITAELGKDIEAASGTLIWPDGNTDNQTITLTLINDTDEEDIEEAELVLDSSDETLLGANKVIIISISDDDSNTAPQVSLGENIQVNTGQTVTLTATATDAENDTVTYAWETNEATISLTTTNLQTTSFVAPNSAGTLEVTVTATDTKGAFSTSTVTINVIAPPTEVITVVANKSSGGGSTGFYLMFILLFANFYRSTRK